MRYWNYRAHLCPTVTLKKNSYSCRSKGAHCEVDWGGEELPKALIVYLGRSTSFKSTRPHVYELCPWKEACVDVKVNSRRSDFLCVFSPTDLRESSGVEHRA